MICGIQLTICHDAPRSELFPKSTPRGFFRRYSPPYSPALSTKNILSQRSSKRCISFGIWLHATLCRIRIPASRCTNWIYSGYFYARATSLYSSCTLRWVDTLERLQKPRSKYNPCVSSINPPFFLISPSMDSKQEYDTFLFILVFTSIILTVLSWTFVPELRDFYANAQGGIGVHTLLE